jgi:iron complex transport system ATP-binding protein
MKYTLMNGVLVSTPIIEMKRVAVVKDRADLLRDVDLVIERGESIVILGPNGAGKSSLIKTMVGELRHDTSMAGSYIRIRGEENFSLFDVRKAFGLVSGDLQIELSRDINVHEAVISGFFGSIGTNRSQELTMEMETAARSALSLVGSSHLSKRCLATLSTGEARRVLMARALVNQPEALILDEPMSSLDLTGRHIVRESLRALAGNGQAVVMVTHDPSDIIPEMRRVVLMKNGRVIRDGGLALLNPKDLSSLYDVPVKVERIEGRYIAWT